VTPRTHIVYKCEVKDLVSPLAFNIGFPSEIEFKNANLEIFLSANSRTPNKGNHELMFIKQKKFKVKLEEIGKTNIIVDEKQKNKNKLNPLEHHGTGMFEDEYIYLGLHSVNGCSISI